MIKVVATVLAPLVVLALAACTGPSPAPAAGTAPGTCLSAYNGTDADRTSAVACTEEHLFDVFGTAVWPGMADALAAGDAGDLHDQLVDAGSTPLSEAYWDWALPNCTSMMREAIGLTGEIDGVSLDDLDAVPPGPWLRDASLPAREAFIAGDHTTLCSVTWTDQDDRDRAVAYPEGVTVLDMLGSGFPSDQRSCFTRVDNDYTPTACDEPHSGQYLLVFDGLPSLGAEWLATKEVGVGFPDYSALDDYCTVALDRILPGILDPADRIVWSDDWGTAGWEDYDGSIDPTREYPMYCAILAPDSGTLTGDAIAALAAG